MKRIFVISTLFAALFLAVSCSNHNNKSAEKKEALLKEEVTMEISAENGGTMTSSDETISIEIPGDAIDSNTTVTMKIYSSEDYQDTEGRDVISDIVEFGPSGTIFKKPVIISMTSLGKIDNKIITAAVFNESESKWHYSSSGTAVKIAGRNASGDPILQSAAGDPIMLNAAGDPIMQSTGEMLSAAGDPIMVTAAGDPIMTSAAGDPIMMTTGHFTAYTFIALEEQEELTDDDAGTDDAEISDDEIPDDEIPDNNVPDDLDDTDDTDTEENNDNDLPICTEEECKCPDGFCNDGTSSGNENGSCHMEKETHKIYCDCNTDADYKISGSKYYDENPTGQCWYAPVNVYYDAYFSIAEGVETYDDMCVPLEPECLPAMESESASDLCNGLDDDCDGKVDEGCPCQVGQTQPCFLGPRNSRNIGTCSDGIQTCEAVTANGNATNSGRWGECTGSISPTLDICDGTDNNCNGCADYKLCCKPPIDCSFDIGTTQPFTEKIIDGTQIYDTGHCYNDADTATWEWTLETGPCGIVDFEVKGAKTLAELEGGGEVESVVSGIGLSQFKVKFQTSGSYKLHLKVTRENGQVYECEWILNVLSEGLRVELCWDKSGSVDLDLYLGKQGTTSAWKDNTACNFSSCKDSSNWSVSGWGYTDTENYDSTGNLKTVKNPRINDNVNTQEISENFYLDNPGVGDTFRAGVHYYPSSSNTGAQTYPIVNVYCGGILKATFGKDPQLQDFADGNDFWKVVEIMWLGEYGNDECVLTPKLDDDGNYVVSDQTVPEYSNW